MQRADSMSAPMRPVAAIAAAMATVLAVHHWAVAQQPCNPLIDGTYCAEQMPRKPLPTKPSISMTPIQDLGSAISLSPSSAGTLGGISFRGGTTCISLMRRGACN
jgi:hypothetical protein